MSKGKEKQHPASGNEIEKVDKGTADPKPGGPRSSAREAPEDRAQAARKTTSAGKARSQ